MTSLRIASVIDHTEAEGPGVRFAIWTQGCTLACPGCCNPHLWGKNGGRGWTVADLLERVLAAKAKRPALEGVSLIGGEPFEQDAPLAELARQLRAANLSVMVYSGYTIEELRERGSELLEHVDLLVDGRYVEALRTTKRRFIGSTNQRLHVLSDAYSADDPRFSEANTAEIHLNDRGEIQVVGFPFDSVQRAFGPRKPRPRKAGLVASARLPSAGPLPTDPGRTPEQRAALWGGGVFLLACLLSVDLAWRVILGATDGLIVSAIPVAYLGVAWGLFFLGLVKLTGDRHERSTRRGPWLVVGLVFALICGPLAASVTTGVDRRQVTFTCDCGTQIQASGRQNCWGHWLERKVAIVRATSTTASTACAHPLPALSK